MRVRVALGLVVSAVLAAAVLWAVPSARAGLLDAAPAPAAAASPASPAALARPEPATPPRPAPAVGPRPAPAAAPRPAPAPVPPSVAALPAATTQAVVVRTPSSRATRGDISTWQRGTGGAWSRVLGPVPAWVGQAGTGASSESAERTPEGRFGLTRAFGRAANPGTALPWFHAGPSDWWVSDARSKAYNTHQVCRPGACPFDEKAGENLDAFGAAYDDAVVIDANTNPVVPGRGSAYFLHIGSAPTAGCVATDRGTVTAIMRWLRPAAHPVITVGR